ncbi:unnamed protein product [marine sediment metagenome]|uniref:Uncharacterized protein n=1 Tax=marine sediment metagenome TaxID=412755 RepID=X1T5X6_9ZZZZ
MIELNKGDHVKLRLLGHYWVIENDGKYYTALVYKGKHIIVDKCKIKHKKVRGKYMRIRR